MDIVHFADLHIGVKTHGRFNKEIGLNSRVVDYLRLLDYIVEYSIDNVDLVVCAGDVFHTRQPHPTHLQEFVKQIMRLSEAGVPVVILPGNHDVPVTAGQLPALNIFNVTRVPNVYVPLEPLVLEVDTNSGMCQVGVSPFPIWQQLMLHDRLRKLPRKQLDSAVSQLYVEQLQELSDTLDERYPSILVSHATIKAATSGSEADMMHGHDIHANAKDFDNMYWDYVALGHIHKHQDVNPNGNVPVVYSGSVGRVNFGEQLEPKGFCHVHIDDNSVSYEFIPLDARVFSSFYVDARYDDPLAILSNMLNDVTTKGHISRISVQVDGQGNTPRSAIEQHVIDNMQSESLDLSIEEPRLTRSRDIAADVAAINTEEALNLWFDSRKIVDDRDEYMNLAREIIEDLA